ncbi:MAG: ABC transporter substrate-binding protein [Alcaligenaceae bacterium]|nr:MAG: ABC transporter substrate-binding protein [Alcaligenaceae bacterium]
MLLQASSLLMPALSQAQSTWPNQSVKIVVPWATGGTVDMGARVIGQKIAEQTGQPVVVENKPGASSTIGFSQVLKSNPDGYTLIAFESSYAILPSLFKKLSWSHADDLAVVGAVFQTPMVLVVPEKSPFKTVQALIEFGRLNPGKLNFGSGGVGSSPHLSGELLQKEANIKLTHIPYKGGGEALSAVVAGNVDLLITATPTAIGHVQGGRVRALAVTGTQRSVAFPAVPTLKEAGLSNYVVMNWYGLGAPKNTPTQTLNQIYQVTVRALSDPGIQSRFAQQGVESLNMNPSEFSIFIKAETIRWTAISQAAGLTPE